MDNNDCNFTNFSVFVNNMLPELNGSNFGNCTFGTGIGGIGPDKTTEISLKLLFYSLATIANSLLLFVMFKDPLKRFGNSTSYFIMNLALADLMSIIAGIFQSMFEVNNQKVNQTNRREMTACFAAIGEQSSFLIIMIFAIDRYMAIGHPYIYRRIVQKMSLLIILILLPWCFSSITLPVIYFAPAYKHKRALTNLFAGDIIALSLVTLIIHPLTHWQFKRKFKRLAQSSYADKNMMEENLKIAKVLASTVLLVSGCLIVFMLPYFIAFCFSLSGCDSCFLNEKFTSFWSYYPLLRSVRLMGNSLVYAWRLPLYRRSLKSFFENFNCFQRTTLHENRVRHELQVENNEKRDVIEMQQQNQGLECDQS